MGSITTRALSDGSKRFVARLRFNRGGRKVLSESKSFPTEDEATLWLGAREAEIESGGDLAVETPDGPRRDPTIAEAIARYLEIKREGKTSKFYVLRSIAGFRLGRLRCSEVTAEDIIDFAQSKARRSGVSPQTITRYIAELSAVCRFARLYWKAPIDAQAVTDAWTMAANLGIADRSRRRDRRPTLAELDRLLRFFYARRRKRPNSIPLDKVIAFAIFSTRRRSEICRIRWADLDPDARQILVRDLKSPGSTRGNNVRCDLPDPALAIVRSMPRTSGRIFPFDPESISTAFRRACRDLNIRDLHFHDLRHEGVSRLFELGLGVEEVGHASGHKSWTSIQRYTHLNRRREKRDKYEGWPWHEIVAWPHWNPKLPAAPEPLRRGSRKAIKGGPSVAEPISGRRAKR